MKHLAFLFALLLCGPLSLRAQLVADGFTITCSNDGDTTYAQETPIEFRQQDLRVSSNFQVEFTDSVPPEAENAIRFAADVWGSYLISDVPINVSVDWRDRGDERLLASAGPTNIYANFVADSAAISEVWYPVALAEAIAGQAFNADTFPDIVVVVNSTANWNFTTEGGVSRARTDLATVMIHELAHGLGFLSSIDSTTDTTATIGFEGNDGVFRNIIYDVFLETPPGRSIVDTTLFGPGGVPSREIALAVVEQLDWNGDSAMARFNDTIVPLFAPETFDVGSSVSHLDEQTFARNTPDALMTPQISNGEAIRTPGPVVLGMLADMGWPLRFELDVSTNSPEVFANTIRLYPNPASTHFVLPLDKFEAAEVAVLYGSNGQEVRRVALPRGGAQATIDVQGLRTGMYVVAVPDGRRVYVNRIMVK